MKFIENTELAGKPCCLNFPLEDPILNTYYESSGLRFLRGPYKTSNFKFAGYNDKISLFTVFKADDIKTTIRKNL
jgi:hypothetical protein